MGEWLAASGPLCTECHCTFSPSDNQICLQTFANVLWGPKEPSVKNHWLKESSKKLYSYICADILLNPSFINKMVIRIKWGNLKVTHWLARVLPKGVLRKWSWDLARTRRRYPSMCRLKKKDFLHKTLRNLGIIFLCTKYIIYYFLAKETQFSSLSVDDEWSIFFFFVLSIFFIFF